MVKGHHEQSRGCGYNSMTVLILLNSLLIIIFFAFLVLSGNIDWSWFNRQGLETKAIQDPSMRGLSTEQSMRGSLMEQLPKNAKPLSLEQNGIDLNDLERRSDGSNVIYL